MSPAKTHITGIRAVSIPVENQDDALRFYVDTLGFTSPLSASHTEHLTGREDLRYHPERISS